MSLPHPFLQVGYWEVYDGSQIRELEGSKSASINGMDICGSHFVTGGGDKLIKVCTRTFTASSTMYYTTHDVIHEIA